MRALVGPHSDSRFTDEETEACDTSCTIWPYSLRSCNWAFCARDVTPAAQGLTGATEALGGLGQWKGLREVSFVVVFLLDELALANQYSVVPHVECLPPHSNIAEQSNNLDKI